MSAEDWPGVHPNNYLFEKVYTRKDLEDEVRAAENAGRVAERTRCAQLLYRAQRGNEKGGSEADHIRATVLLGMREAIDRGGACRETDPFVKLYSRNDLHFVIALAETAAKAERECWRQELASVVDAEWIELYTGTTYHTAEAVQAVPVTVLRELLRRLEGL